MSGIKLRLGFGLALLAGTCSLAGCVSYAPQPAAPTSTTTTESTTTQQPPVLPGQPAQTTTVTTTGPSQ